MITANPSRIRAPMNTRPSDLPDFAEPPLIEAVLGIQFERIKGFRWVHLGPLWELFRKEFPNVQEQPPLNPTYETFGTKPPPKQLGIELLTGPFPLPRIWFLDEAENRLLQFQPDRFIHNWRKVKEGDQYPRYEQIREDFVQKFSQLAEFMKDNGLGELRPNQCEITYVNHIPIVEDENLFANPHVVLRTFQNCAAISPSNQLEDSRVQMRFVLMSSKGTPAGRLVVDYQAAFSNRGDPIVRFTLSAKGQPEAPTFQSAIDFIDAGRERIVHTFDDLTTSEMHERWGRK